MCLILFFIPCFKGLNISVVFYLVVKKQYFLFFQKIFGQNRRMAMFVNGGSNAAFSAPGLGIERYDLPASNQPWSSGKEFTTSADIRLVCNLN